MNPREEYTQAYRAIRIDRSEWGQHYMSDVYSFREAMEMRLEDITDNPDLLLHEGIPMVYAALSSYVSDGKGDPIALKLRPLELLKLRLHYADLDDNFARLSHTIDEEVI